MHLHTAVGRIFIFVCDNPNTIRLIVVRETLYHF